MKRTLTRLTGLTVLGVAVAAGLAFAQSDGAAPNGPGGRPTDARGQQVPAITPAPSAASTPDASTGTGATNPDPGSMDNGSAATPPDGPAISPANQARTSRSPRADRN